MKYFIISVLSVLVTFSGCSALKSENVPLKLSGPQWKLTAIAHKNVIVNDRAYLVFDDDELEVKGKAFCNSITAEYALMGDNQLTFEAITSTKMFCDGIMDLENQMVTNMESVKHYEIRNGKLYLSSSSGEVLLTFKK